MNAANLSGTIALAATLATGAAYGDEPSPASSNGTPTSRPTAHVADVLAPAPVGVAAPATAAGTTGVVVRPGLEVFAEYVYTRTRAADGATSWFHELDVPRAHASLDGDAGEVHARVLFEGVRSAGKNALVGVAGDSVVVRAREAWAAWRPMPWLDARAGIVPTLTLAELDGTWMMRAVAASPSETAGFVFPADVGATARVTLPRDVGFVAVGVYDGEGYAQRELNRGKDVEIAAALHPFADDEARAFTVFGSYVAGSRGTGSTVANRLTLGALWQGARVRAGVDATLAHGVDGDGGRDARTLDAFVRVEPVARWLVGARVAHTSFDTRDASAAVTSVWLATGWRADRSLELFVAATRDMPGDRARDTVPIPDATTLRTIARVVF